MCCRMRRHHPLDHSVAYDLGLHYLSKSKTMMVCSITKESHNHHHMKHILSWLQVYSLGICFLLGSSVNERLVCIDLSTLLIYTPLDKKHLPMIIETILFALVEALRPGQHFFSHVGMFSWVKPVLSNENEKSCSRTQHRAPGEIRTCDLAIKSVTLPTELTVLPIETI